MQSQAIAARSVFLPTISHALSYCVYKNCTLSSLRAKLEKISLDEEDDCAAGSVNSDMSYKIFSNLQKSLWAMLQRHLLITKTAQGIRSLAEVHGTVSRLNFASLGNSTFYSEKMYNEYSESDDYYHDVEDCNDNDDGCLCDYSDISDLVSNESLQANNMLFNCDKDRGDDMLLGICCKSEHHDHSSEMDYEDLLWSSQDVEDEVSLAELLPCQTLALERVNGGCGARASGVTNENSYATITSSTLDGVWQMESDQQGYEENMLF